MSIQFISVHKTLNGKTVLKDINFNVHSGEILFILGKSGVGKSVTLKHIVGLMKPDSGQVLLDTNAVHLMDEKKLIGLRKICGMVFQHPALLDSITVYDNIAFGIKNEPRYKDLAVLEKKIKNSLYEIHLNQNILGKKPYELSVGIQKRVSIARAIALDPKYLLFDEPTTGLDPVATHSINQLILNLTRKLNVTSIVVSHDIVSALKLADRIIFLHEGEIVFNGTPQEMRKSMVPIIKAFLVEVPQ